MGWGTSWYPLSFGHSSCIAVRPTNQEPELSSGIPGLSKDIFKTAALGSLCYPRSFCLLFSSFVSLNKELDRDIMMFTKSRESGKCMLPKEEISRAEKDLY